MEQRRKLSPMPLSQPQRLMFTQWTVALQTAGLQPAALQTPVVQPAARHGFAQHLGCWQSCGSGRGSRKRQAQRRMPRSRTAHRLLVRSKAARRPAAQRRVSSGLPPSLDQRRRRRRATRPPQEVSPRTARIAVASHVQCVLNNAHMWKSCK